MRLSLARRVSSEGVPAEMQSTVNGLATVLNPFIEDVTTILNGRVDLDNLAFQVIDFEVMVNSSGIPLTGADIGLNYTPRGSICMNVRDANNIAALPEITGQPYVLFTQANSNSVNIGRVLNLLPNRKYILTLLII